MSRRAVDQRGAVGVGAAGEHDVGLAEADQVGSRSRARRAPAARPMCAVAFGPWMPSAIDTSPAAALETV